MRLFIGIPLADAVAGELSTLVSRLRPGTPNLRWTARDTWHITLQFLGNATAEQLQCLGARLSEVHSPPVPIQIGEPGFFDRAGAFFADVVASPALTGLQQRVVDTTAQCGFATDARPFHPHITLARAKGHGSGLGLRELMGGLHSQPRFSSFTAQEFLLYESHLERHGARYEVLGRFPIDSRRG